MKNLFDIKDKVIVITGGCGILGKNIANYLAEQGAKIVILDRVEEAGRELEAELNRKSFRPSSVLRSSSVVRKALGPFTSSSRLSR